jgi:putative ABC transport system substrate-binding protein
MKNSGILYFLSIALASFLLNSCSSPVKEKASDVPVIGFLDYVEDATLAKAKTGFMDALASKGFSEEKKTISVIYKNAQGDQPTLLSAVDLLISRKPVLIATNTTLATVNTVQRTKDTPVFMMVSPRPDIAKLTDAAGKAPANLFGTYETLDYIDTAVSLIHLLFPNAKTVGTIYSQSESQSVDALNKLQAGCHRAGIILKSLPVTNSSETQLVTQSLLNKGVDVFFALPDNVIFASFETVAASCNDKHVPILTSEAGLVSRGALANYGADFYKWGYQSGLQAAQFLQQKSANGIQPEIVKLRNRVYNPKVAAIYQVKPDSSFAAVN